MITRHAIILALLGLLCSLPLAAQPAQYLTILHLNDTHGNLLPGTPRDAMLEGARGGIARAATVIGQTAMNETPWLLLHAGDASVGDFMHLLPAGDPDAPSLPELEILASLGCTAMTLGNHEFDFSSPGLVGALTNSLGQPPAFPLLSANIILPTDPEDDAHLLANWVQPSIVKAYPGFTVGIIGLTTPMTSYLSDPGTVGFVEDEALLGALLSSTAAALRDGGCNYIILLSHMGMNADKALAANVPGIDLIVSGHDHIATKHPVRVINPLGTVVSIVQTEGFYSQIGRLQLKRQNNTITIHKYDLIDLDAKIPEDATVRAIVDGIATGIEAALAEADAPFSHVFSSAVAACASTQTEKATNLGQPGHHDTHVGNLVADAYQNMLGVDIGLVPGGSTAQPLYPGPITANDLYRMIGYGANTTDGAGFPVVTFALTGQDLLTGLNVALADIETDDELFMQVSSNLTYFYDPSNSPDARLVAAYFKGQPVDPSAVYTIGTNWMVAQYVEMLNTVNNLGMTILQYAEQPLGEFALVFGYVTNLQVLGGRRTPGRVVAVAPMTARKPGSSAPMAKIASAGPNPFTDHSTIVVEATDVISATVRVYDMLGREVATLRDGDFALGQHRLAFDGSALPCGMYECRLTLHDGSVQSTRIIKVR